MLSKDHVGYLYANMLEHHGEVQRLCLQLQDHAQEDIAKWNMIVHKWLCQLLNSGSITRTITPYFAGQMVKWSVPMFGYKSVHHKCSTTDYL
ncbi:hypothetical protein T11_7593 [Trichinella zimbabwensis]|uniref:Uncharacterized protein n=1 Tax=Trichinella zimbabwensis TaxID=268475 RepID=A0A0V1GLI4_9BILA|nr:hypothetical protein T11_7593 [Trichinella zimbabwensis]